MTASPCVIVIWRRQRWSGALALIALLVAGFAGRARGEVAAHIQRRLLGTPAALQCSECARVHAGDTLRQHYRQRRFAPLWVAPTGPLPLFDRALAALAAADRHGLPANDYHLECLVPSADRVRRQLAAGRLPGRGELATLDIALTDALLTFGIHLATGKVDPEQLYPLWVAQRPEMDVSAALRDLGRHRDLDRFLRQLAPPRDAYWRLVRAAENLEQRVAAGGWLRYEHPRNLQRGMRDRNLTRLRARLQQGGDLPAGRVAPDPTVYDSELEQAVRSFQARHGLAVDGILGPSTRRALNVPAAQRVRQLRLNLERWRWLPQRWGERYLLVNAADYSLVAYDRGQPALHMKVIVGKQYRRTPVFSEKMSYLVINPYWNVPDRISARELLPRIQRDRGYLVRHGYELLSGWGVAARQLDAAGVAWKAVTPATFPGRLRQRPGEGNRMGRIKFMFPNRFNVYLHDTPGRHLFQRDRRAFSHGCIRVEKPVELAAFLLQEDDAWSGQRIRQQIARGARTEVPLPRSCMVHLLYWTAWVAADGTVHFRPDVYRRDEVLWAALHERGADAVEVSRAQDAGGEPEAAAN